MAKLNVPSNHFALAAKAPVSRGPSEDAPDRKGDSMRPLTPAPISPRNNGRGHMGSWADKAHPMGKR